MPFLYYGKRYEAASIGVRLVAVRCDQCGFEYFYELARIGAGSAHAPYGIGQSAAARSSTDKSQQDLGKRLSHEAELVPCPKCHWINDDMISGYRQSHYRRWATFAVGWGCVGTVASLICAWFVSLGPQADRGSLPFFLAVGPAGFLASAAAVLLLRNWLRRQIRPNDSYPSPPKLPSGAPPPLIMDPETGQLQPATQPIPTTDVNTEWIETQVGRIELPKCCCGCLSEAEPNRGYEFPLLPPVNLQVPFCTSCTRRQKRRQWLIGLATFAIATGVACGLLAATRLEKEEFVIFAAAMCGSSRHLGSRHRTSRHHARPHQGRRWLTRNRSATVSQRRLPPAKCSSKRRKWLATLRNATESDWGNSVKIRTVRLVYFSPTGTTLAILENIAEGICADAVRHIDVTLPGIDRHDFPEMEDDELLLIGAPVYAGRIPEIALRRFQGLKSNGNPAVIVVLYGNREYEDALLELSDLALAAGFAPVAAAAFIGEHSFSTESTPLAKGRPDESDIRCARNFGASIGQYLHSVQSLGSTRSLELPGNRPFRKRANLPKTSPATDNDRCTACGACAAACPTGSILINKSSSTNVETCILCCACAKVCPADARTLEDPFFVKTTEWLSSQTAKRKEPEVFPNDIANFKGLHPAPQPTPNSEMPHR